MTTLYGQYGIFHEPVSTNCSHGRSGIVRGVVSGAEAGTSDILPVGRERPSREVMRSRRITNCGCGVPDYLMGLDEPLIDHALENFIASLGREREARRAKTHIVSAMRAHAKLPSGIR